MAIDTETFKPRIHTITGTRTIMGMGIRMITISLTTPGTVTSRLAR